MITPSQVCSENPGSRVLPDSEPPLKFAKTVSERGRDLREPPFWERNSSGEGAQDVAQKPAYNSVLSELCHNLAGSGDSKDRDFVALFAQEQRL